MSNKVIDRSCLSYWFPVLERHGMPVPKTWIVRTELDLIGLLDGEDIPGYTAFLNELRAAITDLGGCPVFLRTGHTSGKHEWNRNCYLADERKISLHVWSLVEHSHIVDLFGLPTDVWVVRELLPTAPAFHAFWGTPINKERRYFVRDGQVEDHGAYWPADALFNTDSATWEGQLEAINTETDAEIAELSALSKRVGQILPGYWSVDWLWVPDRGWVCIDMAEGGKSWHWSNIDMPT